MSPLARAARRKASAIAGSAFAFVLVMGFVNLFADTTYEGGASINGPFMLKLGAGAATVSIVAGMGEFLGYALRSVAGYASDRSGKYWAITFVGYTINLIAVPAVALAGSWPVVALLIFAERVGRALRKPTVEAMLSYTTGTLGKGWVYALNNALDETGAVVGPLAIALVLSRRGSYQTGYALLLVPAVLALASLTLARVVFPLPERLEEGRTAPATGLTSTYWLYMAAAACFAAGLMSFELISYHLATSKTVTGAWIPFFLALSTVAGIVASLAFGKLYDRVGLPAVLLAIAPSAAFAPLVFFGSFSTVLVGMLLWGIGYAVQDTLFKALVASVLPEGRRNLAFGLFYAGYGVGWLAGSIATGVLYERSRLALVIFSVAAQIASMPVFLVAARAARQRSGAGAR